MDVILHIIGEILIALAIAAAVLGLLFGIWVILSDGYQG